MLEMISWSDGVCLVLRDSSFPPVFSSIVGVSSEGCGWVNVRSMGVVRLGVIVL